METKKVVDVYGREVEVEVDSKKLYNYSNKNKQITYCYKMAGEQFWTDVIEEGIVEDIEERLNVWNNPVKFHYGISVNCDAKRNDPDKEKWNKTVEYVKSHQDEFFTKAGDWKKRVQAKLDKMEVEIVDNK